MRASMLLLMAALLLPWGTARAQAADAPPAGPARPVPIHSLQLRQAADAGAPYDAPRPRRNRLAGAAIGFGVGAAVGGVWFARMNYLKSKPPTTNYTTFSLVLGGAVGGAAGALIGAAIGTPGRSAGPEEGARLRLAPGLPDGRGAVSLAVDVAL
ncbi:MAG TPA: hypothetical protein VF615_22750 [Longimicrobiaceae bacterium]